MISKKLNFQLPYLVLFIFLIGCKKDKTTTAPTGNWEKLNTGTSQSLNDLHFYNGFGTISGDFGTILKTSDAGNSWTVLTSPVSHSFTTAFTLSENDLFVGRLGLYKSNNSGTSFSELGNTSTFGGTIAGVYFSDSLSGVMSKGGSIYTTNDGGLNWTNTYQQYGYASILNYTSDSTFYLLGGRTYDGNSFAEVHKSTDNGKTWVQLNLSFELNQSQILASSFLSDSIGFVATINNKLFKTKDGGDSWSKVTDLDFFAPKKMLFINSTTAYIIADNSVYKSIDSGKNWSLDYKASDNTIFTDLEANFNNTLFITDNKGNVYRNYSN